MPGVGTCFANRDREIDSAAVILGAGHTGLEIATRLECLRVRAFIIDESDMASDVVLLLAT